jgi:hypothetical protein
MQLIPIPQTHIDLAWHEGASCLNEACDVSGGEITADQLKMVLSRGERSLLKMWDGERIRGWCVIRIDQLPNMRVLFITNLVAHNSDFKEFFIELKEIAKGLGCSSIRCGAGAVQERLYRMHCGFEKVYSILEVKLWAVAAAAEQQPAIS